jgi:hypothetical protein
MLLEVEKLALLPNRKLVLVVHSKPPSLIAPVTPGPKLRPPFGSPLLLAPVQNVPFLFRRIKPSLVSPPQVAHQFVSMRQIVMTTTLVLEISAIPTETKLLQNIVDMSQMLADVNLPPNVERGIATLLLVVKPLLSLSVTITTFVPTILVSIPLVACIHQVPKLKIAETQMIVTLHSVTDILVVSKTNSTVTHLTIVLLLVAIPIGTTNLRT